MEGRVSALLRGVKGEGQDMQHAAAASYRV
jgi:hypothetical protein